MKKLFINLLLMLATFVVSHAQTGSLDPNFGNGGISLTSGAFARTSVQQSDGKIVVVGMQFPDMNIERFMPDGSLDSSFGINGRSLFPMNGNNPLINNVIVQPDGKIVMAGSVLSGYMRMFACRINANGSIDSTFGNNGILIHTFQAIDHESTEVHNTLDGKLLISGTTGSGPRTPYYLKLNLDGSNDNSYGVNGVVFITGLNYTGGAYNTQLQVDGKIISSVIDGNTGSYSIKLFRLNSDGSIDNTFGLNGVVNLPTTQVVLHKIAIQSDGKIVVAGGTSISGSNPTQYVSYLARFLSNGTLDIGFGSNGISIHNSVNPLYSFGINKVALQPSDNKIVIWGGQKITSNGKIKAHLSRFNTNGNFDTEFGDPAVILFPNEHEEYLSGHIASDGGIVAVGSTSTTRILAKYISCANSVTAHPQNISREVGTTATFSAGSSSTSAQYQWQQMGATDWENLSNGGQYAGVQTATLSINNLTLANTGTQYRTISTSGVCADTSAAALLTVTPPNSIKVLDISKYFSVHPNPTKDQLIIEGNHPLESILVYDILGRRQLHQSINNQQKIELSLKSLNPGMYWIVLNTEQGVGTYKIVKE